MQTFLKAFLVFLAWFCLAFLYLTTDASKKIKSFLVDFNAPKIAENKVSVVNTDVSEKTVELDIELQKNKGLLHVNDKLGNLLFSLDSLYILKNSDSVYFKNSKEVYFKPITNYLNENTHVEIIINSEYSATENFNTPNIGQKRGAFLINELSSLGVNRSLLSVKSLIRELDFNEKNQSFGVVSFQIKPIDEVRKSEIESKSVISQIVYPTFTFSKIIANQELQDFAKELKQLFDANPNRKAQIIGHTDNIGSAIDNYQLGLKYAQQVRWYLINKEGLDPSRLTALSEGESNPIDDNNSQIGRKNNLRIEFIIE